MRHFKKLFKRLTPVCRQPRRRPVGYVLGAVGVVSLPSRPSKMVLKWLLNCSWGLLERSGSCLGKLEVSWRSLGAPLGASWGFLDLDLELSESLSERSWSALGANLELS